MSKKKYTCTLCRAQVPVETSVGLKFGRHVVAACETCAPKVREAAFNLGVLLREVVNSRFPYVGQAFDMTMLMLSQGQKRD